MKQSLRTWLFITAAALAAAVMIVTLSWRSSRRAEHQDMRVSAEQAIWTELASSAPIGSLALPPLPLNLVPSSSAAAEPTQDERLVSRVILNAADAEPFTQEDARVIIRGLEPSRHLTTQRSAIVTIADVLRRHPDLEESVRRPFRQVILECLSSKNKHITSSALAAASESGLFTEPEFQAAIQARTSDPDKRLAVMATRLLEQARAPKPAPGK